MATSVFEVARHRVPDALRPYVHEMCGYVERTGTPCRRREAAFPYVVVVFELGPPIRVFDYGCETVSRRHPGGFVAGLGDAFTLCEHDGFQSGLQLDLTPLGARLFFDFPMSEIAGRSVALGDVLPRGSREVTERLAGLPTWSERFACVERLVGERLARSRVRVDTVDWAVRRIHAAGGVLDMRGLARQLGYSRKHVITLFRDQVGVPPKVLARIVRFHRLLEHLRNGGHGTWADLACDFGYADQSHLVREFRQMAGVTPAAARPGLVRAAG